MKILEVVVEKLMVKVFELDLMFVLGLVDLAVVFLLETPVSHLLL